MKAVLGLGEEMKGDDGVGKYIIDSLKKRGSSCLLVYSSVPENAFNKLRGKNIDELTIIDAADFGGKPGEIKRVADFKEKSRLSTHSTSIPKLVRYMKESIGISDIVILLVQAKSLEFGAEMSIEVKKAGDEIVRSFP
jgi:hydrogenase 3 maturation protease